MDRHLVHMRLTSVKKASRIHDSSANVINVQVPICEGTFACPKFLAIYEAQQEQRRQRHELNAYSGVPDHLIRTNATGYSGVNATA